MQLYRASGIRLILRSNNTTLVRMITPTFSIRRIYLGCVNILQLTRAKGYGWIRTLVDSFK